MKPTRFLPFVLLSLALLAGAWLSATPRTSLAQGKKKSDDKKADPRILVMLPLGAGPGKAVKVTIRGMRLDAATAVKASSDKVGVKLVSKGKANVPDKNENQVGNTQVVVELNLPADLPPVPILLSVVTPDGETKGHKFYVETGPAAITDKEPNDGFQQAQPIKLPQVVHGLIDKAKDVDVFKFEGKAGQKIVAEVMAARLGSPLDSVLTLYDANGQQVASNDDMKDSVDSRIEAILPRDGVYFLALIDTHETGGPAHVYRLEVKNVK